MKRVLVPLSIVLILISCSKNNGNSAEFYFRFKANGIQKEYLITGAYFYNERQCVLSGAADSAAVNSITVDLESTVKIKADTTYIEKQALQTRNYPKFYIRLRDNSAGYNYCSWVTIAAGADIYDCTVTLLELDANHVKGRLTGKVSNETETAFITITDGEFNLKRIR